jgi:centromeric protein E
LNNSNQIYAWNIASNETITQSCQTDIVSGRTHQYTLDRVYGPDVTNRQLYDGSVRSLVHAALDGYHTSVLAYGQTSTGKTHTMMGTSRQPGIIPLAIRECFSRIRQAQAGQPREYLLRVSYLEVYKEHIRDLLVPGPSSAQRTGGAPGGSLFNAMAAVPIRLFDSVEGLVIKGLVEEVVTTPEEVFRLVAQGEARRQVGATHLNLHSSRSHAIFRLWIESRSTSCRGGGGAVRLSSLSLVDLAGSESVRLTGSSERQLEGRYINKSLMALGKVVYALSEGVDNSKHVPYRDSKLTRLLQQSLSGSAQVVLICCISPLASHLEESHNTFKFACRVKKIPQHAVIQEADEKTLLQSYRDEIEELKRQLREAQEEQARLQQIQRPAPSSPSSSSAQLQVPPYCDVDEDEISELVKSIQTMERLILKNRPLSRSSSGGGSTAPSRLEDLLLYMEVDDDRDEENLLALATELGSAPRTTPPRKPIADRIDNQVARTFDDDHDLHAELSRIQGLLGSVLKKRSHHLRSGSGTLSAAVPSSPSSNSNEEEVRNLRAQLEMQEVASSFRKADASFLQQQLEEKDDLLQEVSKILEAVEERQICLEEENAALRREVTLLRGK